MMKAIRSLVLFELRRHLPTLAIGSTLLVIGPIVHRLKQGGWNYWDGEWNLAGATVAALAIAPLLALVMALSGGAAERSARMFWTRGAAIL
ncbi:MAG: hypothetical protein GY856_13290, partial [bacterium]|nr:hypothetical protein [bacterium]